jgi:hypothetical protein
MNEGLAEGEAAKHLRPSPEAIHNGLKADKPQSLQLGRVQRVDAEDLNRRQGRRRVMETHLSDVPPVHFEVIIQRQPDGGTRFQAIARDQEPPGDVLVTFGLLVPWRIRLKFGDQRIQADLLASLRELLRSMLEQMHGETHTDEAITAALQTQQASLLQGQLKAIVAEIIRDGIAERQ